MMEDDIVPGLLSKIEKEFTEKTYASEQIKHALVKLKKQQATYSDVNAFAIEVGQILSDVLGTNINVDVLPDGKMHFNIADRVLNETLKNNHELISSFASDVQQLLNQEANLGVKPQKALLNQDRIDGLVNRISESDDFDTVKWLLQEPIVNFSQSIVDDTIKANVDFHSKIGLKPQLRRTVDTHNACKWCRSLAGTYDYPDVPDDIYRRHERCKCIVEYNPKNGRGVQNSHSKEWRV